MSLQAVPVVHAETVAAKTGAPVRGSFANVDASRRLRITPKFGDGEREVEVRYLWAGRPGAPTVIVQGGISADRHVCGAPDADAPGWWEALVGPGRAIDLDRFRVLAIDWVSAAELGTGSVATDDQADILAALMDALHIGRAKAFVGSSYGAMTALAFAARHPHRLERLVMLAGAHRPHPLATAQRSVQRGILRLGLEHGCRDAATSLARQLAMTTYRGSHEFAQRFSGEAEFSDGRYRLPVEAYLEHAGSRFVDRFDPERYLSLSESIDLHRVDPASVRTPGTLIGFATDRLVPLGDLCALQQGMGAPASLEVIDSLYGHDGFLKETAALSPLLRAALGDAV